MMPYRAASPVVAPPGVPSASFPRKNVGLHAGIAITLAVIAIPLPLALLFGLARGSHVFREGGAGMYALLLASLVVAGAIAGAAVHVVRGRRAGAIGLALVPVVPAVIGALLGVLGMRRVFDALAALDGDPDLRLRILAAGLGESDALPAYGTLIAAAACGVAACALLAGGASVDRAHHYAPAGKAWAAPAVFGGLGFVVIVALRLVLRAGFGTMLVAVPSMIIVTALACVAAANAPLVRHWHEPRETDAWVASVLAAALLAAGGFVLLEIGASYAAEARGLAAISGDALDPSQRARILAEVVEEQSAYRTLAIVSGVFGFLAVAPVALAGLGRSSNGRLRFARGAPPIVALGGAIVVLAVLLTTRGWVFGRIEAAAAVKDTSLELPRVPVSERLVSAPPSGTVLRIDESGKRTTRGSGSSDALIVDADRRATWADVVAAIREARTTRPDITAIDLRVTLLVKADRSQLEPYAALLGNETSVLHLALAVPPRARLGARPGDDDDDEPVLYDSRTTIGFRDFELMDATAAAIARRPMLVPSYGARGGGTRADLAIFPPHGSW